MADRELTMEEEMMRDFYIKKASGYDVPNKSEIKKEVKLQQALSTIKENTPTMKVITPGHKYELSFFEPTTEENQTIQFIEKFPSTTGSSELVTLNNGTTNEEVLAVLIDRMNYLQAKFPCRENALVITKLEESLMWLNYRTQKRLQQNVEGKQINHK